MGKKKRALLEITTCRDCTHFKEGHAQSTDDDGFDRGHDWHCTKADKIIAGFVEWHEEKKVEIPNWCPILK